MKNGAKIPSLLIVLVALALAVSFFLPMFDFEDGSQDIARLWNSLGYAPEGVIDGAELSRPSLYTLARYFYEYGDSLYKDHKETITAAAIMCAPGAAAVLMLLFGLLRRPFLVILLSGADWGAYYVIDAYLNISARIATGALKAGPAYRMYAPALEIIGVLAVWMWIAKRAAKRAS